MKRCGGKGALVPGIDALGLVAMVAWAFTATPAQAAGGVSIELIIATRHGESQWIHDTHQLNCYTTTWMNVCGGH